MEKMAKYKDVEFEDEFQVKDIPKGEDDSGDVELESFISKEEKELQMDPIEKLENLKRTFYRSILMGCLLVGMCFALSKLMILARATSFNDSSMMNGTSALPLGDDNDDDDDDIPPNKPTNNQNLPDDLPLPYISSWSHDGVGHQIDAKFSCLGVAAALGATYVHDPISMAEHGTDPEEAEAFFGVGEAIKNFPFATTISTFNESTLIKEYRDPSRMVGHCKDPDWLDALLPNNKKQKQNLLKSENIETTVYTGDNCWSHFWCHAEEIVPIWKKELQPVLRESFLYENHNTLQHKNHDSTPCLLSVVVHARFGSHYDRVGDRKTDMKQVQKILSKIIETADAYGYRVYGKHGSKCEGLKTLQLIVHTDADEHRVDGVRSLPDLAENVTVEVTINAKDSKLSTNNLDQAVYDMVNADIFLAAESSMSNVAALLREKPVIYPDNTGRAQMFHFGWHIVNYYVRWEAPNHVEYFNICTKGTSPNENSQCAAWEPVSEEFWPQIINEVIHAN